MSKPTILIAVPCYGGSIKNETHISLTDLAAALTKQGVPFLVKHLDIPVIDLARNYFAAMMLTDKRFTHLLFIDSDMSFAPIAVDQLHKHNKPLIGAGYAKRHLDLEKFYEAAKIHSMKKSVALASHFSFQFFSDSQKIEIKDGISSVESIGMGLTLIRREVFEKLIASGKIDQSPSDQAVNIGFKNLTSPIYGFFDSLYVDGRMRHEDYSFCHRWRAHCRGDVWAAMDIDIGHIGSFTYRTKFTDRF